MELTKEKALELSIFKWEIIIQNNGQYNEKVFAHPKLKKFPFGCALCGKYLNNSCEGCPFVIEGNNCGDLDHPYDNWLNDPTKENAQIILDELKKLRT